MPLRQALSNVCSSSLPRIHVLSDLHLESGPYVVPKGLEYDVLVAAGDIGPVDVAVPWLASLGKPVVYVLGNHERWGQDMTDAVQQAKILAHGTHVHVLEKEAVVVCGVRFLGATLWTDLFGRRPEYVNAVWRHMRDYSHITCANWLEVPRNRKALETQLRFLRADLEGAIGPDSKLHPLITYVEHKRTIAWLKRALSRDCEIPTVVVTHHAPSFESLRQSGLSEGALVPCRWGYRDSEPARVAAYASQLLVDGLSGAERSRIHTWCHGHTHTKMAYLEGGVQVLCNPRGRKTSPLTAESARAYALFGVAFSQQDIERSQKAHAAEPYAGDGVDFDSRFVLDLTLGVSLAVTELSAKPMDALQELAAELREVALVAGQGSSTKDECVTRWFEHLLHRFNDQLDLLRTKGLSELEGREHVVFPKLESLPYIHLWSPLRANEPYTPEDFHRAMATVESNLVVAAQIPQALTRYLRRWAKVSLECLAVLHRNGIEASAVALAPDAFRSADGVELRFCLTHDNAQASEEPSQHVERLLESSLNPKGPPRAWLPRVYVGATEAPARLLSLDQLQALAHA